MINSEGILSEISYRTSRSSGPGGQSVNKTETRVEALFDIRASMFLSEVEKARVLMVLKNRINAEGILMVAASDARSQLTNKRHANTRLLVLLEKALRLPRKRKKTTPSAASRLKRLQAKKQRSEIKKIRSGRGEG